jgi:hypothetical protein
MLEYKTMNNMRYDSIEKIGIVAGIFTFIFLGLYFLAMKLLGLVHMIEFRLLNGVIMFFGCFSAVKMSKNNLKDFDFLKGYGAGLLTALIASTLFALFGFIYLQFINPSFIQEIKSNELLGIYQNKYIASAQIFIEGAASGFLFTHASVVWFKKDMTKEVKKAQSKA